jgi:hypothetical protein
MIFAQTKVLLLLGFLIIFADQENPIIYIAGSDECDRIAKVYKCGVDKDPDLVSNMMQVADVSTPVVRYSSGT